MADKYFLCIIGEMDRLWFQQIILFPEPTASIAPEPSKTLMPISKSLSSPPLPDEETSTKEAPSAEKQVSSKSISVSLKDDSIKNEDEMKERLARMILLGNRIHSHSLSTSTQNRHRKFRKPASCTRKLQKSMSCRTMRELELDEVKGLMDLGFIFKKENLSPRMMSVVPGLQRLCIHQNEHKTQQIDATETVRGNDIEGEEEKGDIMRPYLSEAWLIKRPDSPLLNLKVPKLCSAADMKKHIRFWAKTVASEIQE